jgi:hypothetical protein
VVSVPLALAAAHIPLVWTAAAAAPEPNEVARSDRYMQARLPSLRTPGVAVLVVEGDRVRNAFAAAVGDLLDPGRLWLDVLGRDTPGTHARPRATAGSDGQRRARHKSASNDRLSRGASWTGCSITPRRRR